MNKKCQIRTKYFFDILFGFCLLILFSPVFLIIAAIIKIDDGNCVFFRQNRPGLNGKSFLIWKFRTMIPNADSFLNKDGTTKGFNRITNVGKVLRYLSVDELPQLFNIVRGEMSFVGPRPGLFEHFEKYTPEQKKRYQMKPGITGLAQINGRNTLKWTKRIEYDLEYIKNYSIGLDLKILLKTIKVVIFREGIVIDRNPDEVDDL